MEPPAPPARLAVWALLIVMFMAISERAWSGAAGKPLPLSKIATSATAPSAPAPSAKRPCRCRYDGQKFELGAIICMSDFNGGLRALQCGMELNNTSWIAVPGGCRPGS